MTRIKKLFLFVLVAAMTVALSLGIASCGEEEKPVTYTVTVTCEDESALSGVKARLEKEGKKSEEKALSGGKASFELEAGTYTVVLTGVPDEYSYETKTVTENAPNASVTLTKKTDPPDGLVFYTVTVTCEDETALSGVKVRLMLGTTVAEEQPLSDGKASFKLAPANYTATLTGVPAGYTYEPKTLVGPNYNVTIALTKVSSSADVTVKVAAGTDIFGKSQGETLLKNAQVKIYRAVTDKEPVASAVTDESGAAHFENLTAGRYLVNVNGKEFSGVAIEGGAAAVTLNEKLGSKYAPFVWTVGKNEVPFTREALESLGDDSVYYTLTVSEKGLYSFDADNYNVNVTCDAIEGDLNYTDDHIAVELTAGTVYTFACTSTGALADSGEFGYAVTVTKGDTQEGGTTPDPDNPDPDKPDPDTPSGPWSGSGTAAQPYIIGTLVGEYKDITVEFDGATYNMVYFKYMPEADGSYTVTLTKPENALMTFVGARPVVGQVNPVLSGAEGGFLSADIKLTKGTAFTIQITGNDEAENPASFSCSFKVETYTEPAAKKGSVYDPETLADLLGTHVVTTANTYYCHYRSAEAGVYAVSTAYSQGIVFSVRTELDPDPNNYDIPKGKKIYDFKLSISDLGKFELEADKDYYFAVSSNAQGEASGAEATLNFTIEKFVAGEPDGTQANPYPLETLFGEHTYEVDGAGSYFEFTLTAQTKVKVTAIASRYYIEFIGSTRWMPTKDGEQKEFTLSAGKVILHLYNYENKKVTAHIKIEQVGSGTAASGETAAAAVYALSPADGKKSV